MADWSSKILHVPKGTHFYCEIPWSRGSGWRNDLSDCVVFNFANDGATTEANHGGNMGLIVTANDAYIDGHTAGFNHKAMLLKLNDGRRLYCFNSTNNDLFEYSMELMYGGYLNIGGGEVSANFTIDDLIYVNEFFDPSSELAYLIADMIGATTEYSGYTDDGIDDLKQIKYGSSIGILLNGIKTSNVSTLNINIYDDLMTDEDRVIILRCAVDNESSPITYRIYALYTNPNIYSDCTTGSFVGLSGKMIYWAAISEILTDTWYTNYVYVNGNNNLFAKNYFHCVVSGPDNQYDIITLLDGIIDPESDLGKMADRYLNDYVPVSDFMDLNTPGNSVVSNATYEFVNPKAGIFNQAADQIKMDIVVSGSTPYPGTTKTLIFDIPANSKAWCLFDGETLHLYSDNSGCIFTWGIYVSDTLVAAANQQIENGLIEVPNIFSDYNTGYIPSGCTFTVKIYTNHIFLRQVYYAFNKDEIPTSEDAWYERWKEGTDSVYVRPDGLPDAGGNIVPISTHVLSFNTIAEMKAASDAEHEE